MSHILTNLPYENCTLLDVDGNFLSRCTKRRIESYLRRGLGELVRDDPLTIRLKHVKKDHETDPYVLEEKLNRCVVCGSESELTKHHVIPSCYKVYFPDDKKNFNHHDVLVVCMNCHRDYECKAAVMHEELKTKVSSSELNRFDEVKRIGVVAEKILNFSPLSDDDEIKHCKTIRDFYGLADSEKITGKMLRSAQKLGTKEVRQAINALRVGQKRGREQYLNSLWASVENFYGKKPTEDDLKNLVTEKNSIKPYGHIVASMYNPQVFAEMWRRHFLDSMSPKFMPSGWSETKMLGPYVPEEKK